MKNHKNIKEPFRLLDDWLIEDIAPLIQRISLPEKKFVNPNSPKILKVLKFTKVSQDGSIQSICSDLNNSILVTFPQKTKSNFEIRYRKQLTAGTVNSLFKVKNADLSFLNYTEARRLFELNHFFRSSTSTPHALHPSAIMYAVLTIHDLDIFHRDQIPSEGTKPFLYNQKVYQLGFTYHPFDWDHDPFETVGGG